MEKKRIIRGLIITLFITLFDFSLVGFKKINSINDFFNMGYKDGIFYTIVLIVYFYGFYLFISGIVRAVKKKKRLT